MAPSAWLKGLPLLAGLWLSPPLLAGLPDPLTLEYALSLADEPHPSLRQADALLQAADAEQAAVESLSGLRLDVQLGAQYIIPSDLGERINDSRNDSYARLRLQKRLYDFGHSSRLREAASAAQRQRGLGVLEARQQRRLEIMAAFFQVLLADLEQARDNEAMAIAYIRMDRARTRQELGRMDDVRLMQLESRYREQLSQQRASQARQRSSRARLALSLGQPQDLPSELLMPQLTSLDRSLPDVNELIDQALQGNLQLRALGQAARAAEKRLQAVHAGNGAVLSGQIDATAYHRPLGGDDPLMAGLLLEIPLLTGGQRDADAARQRAELYQARARLSQQEQDVRQSVLDTWEELLNLQTRAEELAVLDEYRELDLDRSRSLYEMEFTADLGDAMTQTSVVRLLLAENKFKRALAWAKLDALMGRLIQDTQSIGEE